MSFKKGDIVRLKKEHQPVAPRLFGRDLEIDYIDDDGLFYLKEVGAVRGKSGDAVFVYRLEPAGKPDRVEGRTIKFKDIRKGDTILNSFEIGDLKITRQGVVDQIGNQLGGGTQLWTSPQHQRIDVDPHTDTYTLVKAAPEVDKVLERVKGAEQDTVVEFASSLFGVKLLARKVLSVWKVQYSDGWIDKTDEQFADLIRKHYDKVRWLG